uniref:Uncharacterized protein n=1 Tax=Cacopsylla melanoneura TaxID=428564 RepID=A0A8D8YUY2_9HEMI
MFSPFFVRSPTFNFILFVLIVFIILFLVSWDSNPTISVILLVSPLVVIIFFSAVKLFTSILLSTLTLLINSPARVLGSMLTDVGIPAISTLFRLSLWTNSCKVTSILRTLVFISAFSALILSCSFSTRINFFSMFFIVVFIVST